MGVALMVIVCLHMGVALMGEPRLRGENPGYWWSGRPRAAGKPFTGGFSPWVSRPPGAAGIFQIQDFLF